MYIVFDEDIVFVFYFAVQSDVRGMGYGSQILDNLKSLYPHRRFILNIEEPDEGSDNHEQRRKRKQFYLRNVFRECRFKMVEKNVVYEMLCCGGDVAYPEYEQPLLQSITSRRRDVNSFCAAFKRSVAHTFVGLQAVRVAANGSFCSNPFSHYSIGLFNVLHSPQTEKPNPA